MVLALGLSASGVAQGQNPNQVDLTEANLEDLMNIKVTSVSKKEQRLSRVGAAVHVISQEEIRRSGATNLPDLLRFVPGVEVAQVNANRWAISIRGFNSVYSNKVLLLLDGRSVYNSTSSSVFWDREMLPLEDIDHIEIIRGPGGTIWGANAMNGVINIITKNAQATPGGLLRAGTGSQQTVDGLVQYGGTMGSKGAYRIFGKYFNTESAEDGSGRSGGDGWHGWQTGFRSDWSRSPFDKFTVQGDVLSTGAGQTVTTVFANALPLQAILSDRLTNTSGNVLGRWNHVFENGSDTTLRFFYDLNHRMARTQLDETHQTADLDFQHHIAIGARNDLVWGLGYRFESSDMQPAYGVAVLPYEGTTSLFSVFLQDEVQLGHSVFLTLGSKFEHNAYTGFEYEPSAQLVWTPTNRHTLWVSGARAIRQPSRVDFGLRDALAILPVAGSFGVLTLNGNPAFRAEEVRDYEAGYRGQINKQLSLDLTAFWSFYRDLETSEPQPPFFVSSQPPHMEFPLMFENNARARTYGTEFFVDWEVTKRWRLSPGYAFLHMAVERSLSSRDSMIEQTPGNSPEHHFEIRSFVNVLKNVDWDNSLQYVSGLSNGGVPSYVRLDTRLGWRLGEFLEISVTGQNLLQPRHAEFAEMYGIHPTYVPRSGLAGVTWRF